MKIIKVTDLEKRGNMLDQLMSLSKIFSETIFRIPDYQRGYAWGEKEVNDFWNDLCRLQGDKNHYVGVLTLEPVSKETYSKWIDDTWLINSKKYTPYYVVDGQQRLTTAILLINSILEIMNQRDIKKLNFTSDDKIMTKFIFESKDENNSRTYIFAYEANNPSYEYLITKIFKEKSEHSSVLEETTYTSNLLNSKNFFINKLKELNIHQLEEVYKKITQQFLFNNYVISSDIDVFVTFETMNNRGKPLSHLELLKNRLIYLSTLFDIDESNRARLRRNINICWKDIYHYLGKNKDRQLPDDEFLNAHFQLYFCKEINSIYENLKNHNRYHKLNWIQQDYLLEQYFVPESISGNKLKVEDVFDYIENLKSSIKLWNFINNPKYSDFDEEIQEYLLKISYLAMNRNMAYYNPYRRIPNIKILLLACLEKYENESTLLKLLKSLEKYLFIMSVCTYECLTESDQVEVNFEEMVIKIENGDIKICDIQEKLDKTSNFITSSLEISKKLIDFYGKKGFYQSDFLKYFLCEYEVYLMKQSKTIIEKLNRDVLFSNGYNSIEHIYPQNAHHKYWTSMFDSYSTKEKNSLRNSLGNFVIVSLPKNSKLGNKPFNEKKCNYQNSMGYKYGTYAEIELTNYENWGADEILERGIKLLNFLSQRWGIKIGTGKKSDKNKFLGLSFMNN